MPVTVEMPEAGTHALSNIGSIAPRLAAQFLGRVKGLIGQPYLALVRERPGQDCCRRERCRGGGASQWP